MSLFTSAFDNGSSGPSFRPLGGSPAGGNKRKRPSTGGKEDQLKATQANLAKLMARVEDGVADKGSKQGLGEMPKKRKGKKGKKSQDSDSDDEPAPKRQAPPAKKKAKGTKWTDENASGSGANSVAVTPSARFTGAKAARGKPEPFDLPMPKVEKKKDEGEGLTDMQRGMKTKLEGARFR